MRVILLQGWKRNMFHPVLPNLEGKDVLDYYVFAGCCPKAVTILEHNSWSLDIHRFEDLTFLDRICGGAERRRAHRNGVHGLAENLLSTSQASLAGGRSSGSRSTPATGHPVMLRTTSPHPPSVVRPTDFSFSKMSGHLSSVM